MPNSLRFLAFLFAAAAVYRLAPARWRAGWLLAASYLYYAAWSPAHAALLLAATLVAYAAGLRLAKAPDGGTKTVALALLVLLASLAFYKYFGALAALTGSRRWLALAVPVGISYYTFKLMSYVIDVHWGKLEAQRSVVALACYAAFFPQIPCGPIARPEPFFEDLAAARPAGADQTVRALRLILFGWFEKAVVADHLAAVMDAARAHPGTLAGWPSLLACYAYCWRIYADFSGVTDIAIGAALLFGLRSPANFDAPFYAPNVQEFWRRWHMSLTSWLTDYLFLPLRMAWRDWGQAGLCLSLMATLLAVGVWHGARLNYAVFGLVNGVYMIVSALTLRSRDRFFEQRPALAGLRRLAGPIGTFNLFAFSLVFFQSATFAQALGILKSVAAPAHADPEFVSRWLSGPDVALAAASLLVMEAVHLYQSRPRFRAFVLARPSWAVATAFYTAVVALLLLVRAPATGFIYFQF